MTESIQSQGTLHSINRLQADSRVPRNYYIIKNRANTLGYYSCPIGQEDLPPIKHSTSLKELWFDMIMYELKQMNAENVILDMFYNFFAGTSGTVEHSCTSYRFKELVEIINEMNIEDKRVLYDKMLPF